MKKPDTYITFNQPTSIGSEFELIQQAIDQLHISGDGSFSKKCHAYLETQFCFSRALLTHSCTAALEMAALLLDVKDGDEVIVPAYTFVSTANAFVLRGAKIVFADSLPEHPNVDPESVATLISDRTRAIVPVHYAGMGCQMDALKLIAKSSNIKIVEDAAQCLGAYYKQRSLGTFGELGTFSFHETKVITCGEGGLLAINDDNLIERAEIIREKGTNRSAFFRGEKSRYEWVDLGSSYLLSDLNAAYLFAQLRAHQQIIERRRTLWNQYYHGFSDAAQQGLFQLPQVPKGSLHNGSIFYLVCRSEVERDDLIETLHMAGIQAVFHYLPLHLSPYYRSQHQGLHLPNAERFAKQLVRLPLFYDLKEDQVNYIIDQVYRFFA